jgi:4-hydroxybenzoate polyprenyltransferase
MRYRNLFISFGKFSFPMIQKSTILHLRIPFSFFLLPVFMFALSQNENSSWQAALLIFIILHFFIYPASNGYNSYYDKDEESIGGLENPPPVSRQLYYTSLVFDLVGIALGLLVNLPFVLMIFIYGLVSKAYSHPSIRLKKYPFISWITAGTFQGYFTFMTVVVGLSGPEAFSNEIYHFGGLLSTALLLGSYPMTQVYQHKEDKKRGDITLSVLLGIKGTFIFTAIVFISASAAFIIFFLEYYNLQVAILFQLFLLPVLIYFLSWFFRILKDKSNANFKSTMSLNFISAVCLNLFFLFLLYYNIN